MSRLRTIAACDASVLAEMSTGDLHYRLGRMLEDTPGRLYANDRANDTTKRCFEGLHIDSIVASTDRLSQFAAEARERMGEERWKQLNEEWTA